MSQPSYLVPTITTALAIDMVQACMKRADEMQSPMSIAVVDSGGHLKAFARMDGSPLLGIELARQKAWSAAAWCMSTSEWMPFIKDDPVLLEGIPQIADLTVLPGGFTIRIDGDVIGGLGVSGSHYSEDVDVAQAGFAASERIEPAK